MFDCVTSQLGVPFRLRMYSLSSFRGFLPIDQRIDARILVLLSWQTETDLGKLEITYPV